MLLEREGARLEAFLEELQSAGLLHEMSGCCWWQEIPLGVRATQGYLRLSSLDAEPDKGILVGVIF